MLAHAGGAASLSVPTWVLAYGAAAAVFVATWSFGPASWPRRPPGRTSRSRTPRGWAVPFGTRTRAVDYSPFSPTAVGTVQVGLAVAGNVGAVVVAAARLRTRDLEPAAARATLGAIGIVVAVTAAASLAVLATNLE